MRDNMGCIFGMILVVSLLFLLGISIDSKISYICHSFGIAERVNVKYVTLIGCWVETDLGYVRLDDYMTRVYGDEQ